VTCELLQENSEGTSGLPFSIPVHQPAVYVDADGMHSFIVPALPCAGVQESDIYHFSSFSLQEI
jgi:hypothetical protein